MEKHRFKKNKQMSDATTQRCQMTNEECRLKSFKNWPREVVISSKILARCGFYYLGRLDEVKCAFCNLQICRWNVDDDPRVVHAYWSPRCQFVKNMIRLESIREEAEEEEVDVSLS